MFSFFHKCFIVFRFGDGQSCLQHVLERCFILIILGDDKSVDDGVMFFLLVDNSPSGTYRTTIEKGLYPS